MKVEKQPEKFSPIVITLETKAEADYFWHRLNTGDGKSWLDYINERGIEDKILDSYNIWEQLDEVYHP